MQTINVSDVIIENMEYIPGGTIDEKMANLRVSSFRLQLRECEEALYRYEAKYGMEFTQFIDAFDRGEFERHSHEIERDCMEWEGFCDERSRMLASIREMCRKISFHDCQEPVLEQIVSETAGVVNRLTG